MNYQKLSSETENEYILRVCQDKLNLGTWDNVKDIINKELGKSGTESKYRKRFKKSGLEFNPIRKESIDFFSNDVIGIQKERMKLQSEKIEFNRNLRELARDELITEKIRDAITSLPPMESPEYIEPKHDIREYLFCFGDSHFAIEYKIPDFYGEIINEYSPDIFKSRMEQLYSHLVKTIQKENIQKLTIFDLGDDLQGLIRLNSQLMQLRYGVVESAILYAEYLATWLNSLSAYTHINFQMVKDSNHNQLRLCGAPKNAFPDENMSCVINAFLKERLKDNKNIIISDNPTGMCHAQLATYIVVGIHGETKNMAKTINDLSRAYQHPIDYLIGAHVHHSKSEEVGIDSEVINIKSIIGVDPYGMSLQKTSNPGASLFVFERGYGKVMEYTYNLD